MSSTNKLIQISERVSVLYASNIETVIENIEQDTSIICFDEQYRKGQDILNVVDNQFIENVVIISKKHDKIKSKKILFSSNINNKIMRKLHPKMVIVIKVNNNYDYTKLIIKNMCKIFEYNKSIFLEQEVVVTIIGNSIYLEDLLNAFKVMTLATKREMYEFIYDTVCDWLDKNFSENNICNFKNDKCIANREGCTTHENMGCCYSFKYAKLFDIRLVTDVKLCQYMQNSKCQTKNIACKLFTCKYLRKRNVIFDMHKILLLDCFFNKKQLDIIRTNYFVSREEILNKLLEEN